MSNARLTSVSHGCQTKTERLISKFILGTQEKKEKMWKACWTGPPKTASQSSQFVFGLSGSRTKTHLSVRTVGEGKDLNMPVSNPASHFAMLPLSGGHSQDSRELACVCRPVNQSDRIPWITGAGSVEEKEMDHKPLTPREHPQNMHIQSTGPLGPHDAIMRGSRIKTASKLILRVVHCNLL